MSTIPSQPATAGNEQPHRVLDQKTKARLQRAVKEFEAVMVGYMLKSMRSSIPKDDMFGESFGADMMEGMFDGELARYVSRGSDLGLGEMLYKEMTGEDMPRAGSHSSGKAGTTNPSVRQTVVPSGATGARAGQSVTAPVAQTVRSAPPQVTLPSASIPAASAQMPKVVRPATGEALKTALRETSAAPAQIPAPAEPAVPSSGSSKAPPDSIRRRLDALDPIIRTASDTTGVNASLLKAVIAAESAGRTQARSSRNAKGLMQLIDSTATAMGVRNVWDPLQNVQGGARYLGKMMDRFGGNIEHALASYNAGPGAVEKHNGIPPYRETQQYVGKVLEYLRYFEQQEAGDDDKD